ncbi:MULTISPECIES: peptidoglycan binding protein CsiV [Shewanella]|uniref:peptidoglycan binding protein CsiV n=1 Tax=Shewanella TaxID=22 RepID=UPI0004B470E8|nr:MULTISPECIES: peptidoglycan binding protein CsiV [Shewanella]
MFKPCWFIKLGLSLSILASLQVSAQEERWFEVEIYLFERQSQSIEQAPEEVALVSTNNAIDMITPEIYTDISAASAGLSGCSAQDWLNTPDECNNQLTTTTLTHPTHVGPLVASHALQYATSGGTTVLLSEQQNQFAEIVSKLSREPGNQSLLHMTWQQSMLPRHQTKPIRLYAGKDFSEAYEANGYPIVPTTTFDIPSFDFLISQFDEPEITPVWQLDGLMNIYLDHYLYVETQLALRQEGMKKALPTLEAATLAESNIEQEESLQATPFLFALPLTQNRRLRSEQIHYFDHPNMGLVLQIRKMVQPDELEEVDGERIIPLAK